ncbi:hypothetical protein VNO80_02690 [Phaseolus coccineus]|uniref:Uncharacterized protein n=1 Tax=Phaseolus coccineus TaxID=3886 RepID=A0AAN9RRJ9_PHACN
MDNVVVKVLDVDVDVDMENQVDGFANIPPLDPNSVKNSQITCNESDVSDSQMEMENIEQSSLKAASITKFNEEAQIVSKF